MSVPDWPNSWGYNMFTFPPSKWVGGILFEHTHRLAATAVGCLTIALMIAAWTTDRRRWVRSDGGGGSFGVPAPGNHRWTAVVLSLRDLAIVHGCAAQLFFCFIAAYCVMTSRFWTERRESCRRTNPAVRSVLGLAIVAVMIILMQLVVGAIMRHSDAGLAIPDFPTSYGHLLPPVKYRFSFSRGSDSSVSAESGPEPRDAVPNLDSFLPPDRSGSGQHRGDYPVGEDSASAAERSGFFRLGYLVLLLLTVQVTLGILTVLLRKPADIASAHVAVGALLLVANWVIAVRAIGVMRATRTDELNRSADLGLQYAATGQ